MSPGETKSACVRPPGPILRPQSDYRPIGTPTLSEQLKSIQHAYDVVKQIQQANAELHIRIAEATNEDPQLEIQEAFLHTRAIDNILGQELEEIRQAYEQTKAELEATQPVAEDTSDDSFDSFITRCLSDIENRDDLVADGSTFTATFTKKGASGNRYFSVTVGNGSFDAEAREGSPS